VSVPHPGEITDEDIRGCLAGMKRLADAIYDELDACALWRRATEIRDQTSGA
jgi:hypothetical protein